MILATHTEAVSLLRGFIAGVGGLFGGQFKMRIKTKIQEIYVMFSN